MYIITDYLGLFLSVFDEARVYYRQVVIVVALWAVLLPLLPFYEGVLKVVLPDPDSYPLNCLWFCVACHDSKVNCHAIDI